MYRFEEGSGFIEIKADRSQKKAIWKLIDNMQLCDKIIYEDAFSLKIGGYFAFYFFDNREKIVFGLADLGDDNLYITVTRFDENGGIINDYYFKSQTHLAHNIKDVIFSGQ